MDSGERCEGFRLARLLGVSECAVDVSHSGAIATWALTLDVTPKANVSNTTTWGTPRALASDLIDDALNGRTPTIYDQIDKDTRVVNQQETIAAREAQQKTQRPIQRMDTGVGVNSILPSIIDTEANRRAMPGADFEKWPKPQDIARMVLFLCSDDSKVVHGAALSVMRSST